MRVSTYEKFNVTNQYFSRIQQDLAKQQLQMATGKSFSTVSEDPLKANQSLLIKGSQGRIEQLQKNISDAKSFLDTAESTVGTAVEILQQSRDIALQAATDTVNAADRETFAKTIDQNIQQMISLANTKSLNRYIFSGEKTQTPAFTYDGTTATYQGDSTSIKFDVSSSSQVEISETGDVAFQDVLNSLINLRDQIRSGNSTNVDNAISTLDTSMDGIVNVRSDLGVRIQSLQLLSDTYEKTSTNLQAKRAEVEGADMTEIVMNYAVSQQLYQATIQSSTKMLQTSILNYIN